MAVISKPAYPPKAGYIEVEYGGRRYYKCLETGTLYTPETLPTERPESEVEQRVTSLEEAIAKGLSLYEEDLG